jgi:predicted Rossmann fold flavoprotein
MIYDSIVVGAGAAGFMTAIIAAKTGAKVLLLDSQNKIGAKILMSGGTRCNVTNKAISEKDYNSHQIMRVRNILRGFDNIKAITFFKDLGVELVLEPTGKYFPTTNSGKTVLDALVKETAKCNVTVKNNHKVQDVKFDQSKDSFLVRGDGFSYEAKTVVLTTGGLSYPGTGSDGTGYRIAQGFGHSVLSTMPALTPFTTNDVKIKELSGVSLPVTLTLYVDGKKQETVSGDFLFTHLGFSGPAALDMSRHWVAAQGKTQIFVNFCPPQSFEAVESVLLDVGRKHPKKTIKGWITDLLPNRLAETLLYKAGIDGSKELNQLSKESRRKLAQMCAHYPLAIDGVVGYSKAEVTAGGVDLSEVNPKTLESIHQKGLYFAGEILDVDGRIGGFNFQWAWASGYCVGSALVQTINKGNT